MKNVDQEHELICNTGTNIDRLKNEVINLNKMISDLETYSDNIYFIKKIKHLKQRMSNEIIALEKNFNEYVDYNESIK